MRLFLFLLCLPAALAMNRDLLYHSWPAKWCWPSGADPYNYGVYHFRKAFELENVPEKFLIHVTADNRYQLYVNGDRVAWGPARGDLFHWRYESIDIAPHLRTGKNVLAAVVWNDGKYRAVAQISNRTGFLLQGDTESEQIVNTPDGWVAVENEAYRPLPITYEMVRGYVAIPPGEEVDAAKYPWGWEQPDYDDSAWRPVEAGRNGAPRDTVDAPNRWFLVPRSIPFMEETPIRLARVRRAEGATPPEGWLQGKAAFTVPARTKALLLLDQNHLTTGYPELEVSGGAGARIQLRYAEALWIKGQYAKGNRDEIEGKEFYGYADVFLPDGGRRIWRPLYWRTWRYIELTVETKDEPLTIEDLRATYTGYPFRRRAKFDAGDEELDRILEIGWRTARLCAHETYMDCPYYEQLQYVGDTRIQAIVSLYMTGDARLMRNAIEQIQSSQTSEGATFSRAPSALQQYIPPFSLWWIGMVHDYWRYVNDPEFVREMLPGARSVLAFYHRFQREDAALKMMPWWNYVDWVEKWSRGTPPRGADGGTAAIDLQLLLALEYAADLERALGMPEMASVYQRRADLLKKTIHQKYWDNGRALYADDAERRHFSQHANILAVLAGLVEGERARELMERVIEDRTLAPASIYFRYYLHRAMVRAGLGDQYLEMLGPWRRMIADGLTTWAERDFRTRSDCHAWGSSPNIELLRTVLGVDSAAPGFARVRIEPHLGKLSEAKGVVPHPRGEVRVELNRDDGGLTGRVELPAGISGEILWRGARSRLRPGLNHVDLAPRSRLAPPMIEKRVLRVKP